MHTLSDEINDILNTIPKFIPFDSTTITEEILLVAEKELHETPDSRKRCIFELKELLEKSERLKPRLDDGFLLRFLRTSKFNSYKAYDRYKSYYQHRKKYPEIFDQLYPSSTTELRAKIKSHYILPYRNIDNSIIVVNTRGLYDPRTMPPEEYLRLDLMCLEIILENPVTQICGLTFVLDLEHSLIRVLTIFTPRFIRCFLSITVGSMPIRFKAIHIINAPSQLFRVMYNLFYPVIPKKVRDRLVIHPNDGNWKSLHSYIPPEVLPEEYGGHLGPLDYSVFQNLLEEREDIFKQHLQYGYTD